MADVSSAIIARIDLNQTISKTILRDLFVTEDKNAHVFRVEITRGGEPVDLTGATVSGWFTRYKDNVSIPMESGKIDGQNVAIITMGESCYAARSMFSVTVGVSLNDVDHVVFVGEGQMLANRTDTILDTSGLIPSVEDIIAQYATMQSVTESTLASKEAADIAASKANAAASHAPYVGVNGNWYVWDTAISKYRDTNVKATGEPGTDGITPVVSATVTTGEPGTQASVTVSGTVENPIFNFVIPRGDTGAVDGVDYYTGTPAPLGTASPGTANGLSRGDHVHPFPIVLSDTEPEVRPALWLNSDPWGTNAAVATMMLEDDESGSDVQIEVDGEDYAVTNTNLGDPESSAYGVTIEEE